MAAAAAVLSQQQLFYAPLSGNPSMLHSHGAAASLSKSVFSAGNDPSRLHQSPYPGSGRVGAGSSSQVSATTRHTSQTALRALDTSMASYTSSTTSSGTPRSASGHAKLHKRGPSATSLPGPPSPFGAANSQYSTPFATYEEPFPDLASLPTTSSTPKIKPYLRKSSKEDQGRLDLSRPVAENEQLSGLGIYDSMGKAASDVTFTHVGRRGTHGRTTSVGSQVSNGSGGNRANQPFVHPMRQTPRPFTPPSSHPASIIGDETEESHDIIEEDLRIGLGFRSRRSMSISSLQPTPLSQAHTAEEFTRISSSVSHSSSLHDAGHVGKGRRPSRPRLNTDHSSDSVAIVSARTSFDKAVGLVSRRTESEPQSREERIRAARRKFEEKEASKDLKRERDAIKRRETERKSQERQRRKSESVTPVLGASHVSDGKFSRGLKTSKTSEDLNSSKLHARSYHDSRPTHKAALPRMGQEAGMSEKSARATREHKSGTPQGSWVRFSAWLQTRLMTSGRAR